MPANSEQDFLKFNSRYYQYKDQIQSWMEEMLYS